ncbi:hypothetical protein MLD63_07500 [Paracoccus sp. TK19116]|uniref:Fibronectin type-III domain-containing protein n=1 Tax=Paracoccus albicereus TaxID=2922394 RepID=A0ABT1MPP4_9RHOB|nr:hypothetical protein [Paracoccus albicereus]MCQ0970265.1 hypothetical protein [Paracoccus albicereus]
MRPAFTSLRLAAATAVLLVGLTAPAAATDTLALEGTLSDDGRALDLSWPPARNAKATVMRRPFGSAGPESWRTIQPSELTGFSMRDDTLEPGQAYEYRIELIQPGREALPKIWSGSWVAGRDVPGQLREGMALLIVDETIADAIEDPLATFAKDLTGAGWAVVRHDVPRHDAEDAAQNLRQASDLRQWITDQYDAADGPRTAVILVGHVPIVLTGLQVPDGHDPHAVPSDLYYADPTGLWPTTQSPDGVPQLLPSQLPAPIPMQIGRIDFANLDPAFGDETTLLAAYLDRNHRWRHAQMGERRLAYGDDPNLRVEINALNNIVGKENVRTAGHDDSGDQPYLMGIDFGEWNGSTYAGLPPSHAIFAINFGSGKHRFDGGNNPMTALLAQPGDVLAVGWGGRPAWQLHGMALNESIGEAHLRTVNNGISAAGRVPPDYPAMGNYDWDRPPWVNLLGDPTLRPFPMAPVSDLSAMRQDAGVTLTWTEPEDAEGTMVLRAPDMGGPWQAMNGGNLVRGSFTDTDPHAGAVYLVRAAGLAQVHAGSVHRLAQGVFIEIPAR